MTISATAKAAMLSQNTSETLIWLMTLTSIAPGGDAIYLCNNLAADITSGGQTYSKFSFDVILMADQDETIPEVTASICNVDRSIVNWVRTQTSAPTITLKAVLASSPNTVELGPLTVALREANWNALRVSGKMRPALRIDAAVPGEHMTPNLFPGLF